MFHVNIYRSSTKPLTLTSTTSHYLKDDAAKEPIAASYSAPGVLTEAAHKTGRAKADFELREISKEEDEDLKSY